MARNIRNKNVNVDPKTFSKEPRKTVPRKKPNPEPLPKPINTNLEGNVKFDKTIYSARQFNGIVDTNFGEFAPSQNQISIEVFFDLYKQLFYDIPKIGESSHTTLVRESSDYIGGYKDTQSSQVESLLAQIANLETQLATAGSEGVSTEASVKEHPVFKNGSIIKHATNSSEHYYMDKGYKRRIYGSSVFDSLKMSIYGTKNPGEKIPLVSQKMLDQIENAPWPYANLNEDNFGDEFIPPSNSINLDDLLDDAIDEATNE